MENNEMNPDIIKKVTKRQVTLQREQNIVLLYCNDHENLMECLAKQDIHINTACGGRGTCGKCKIKLLQGTLEITGADRIVFTEKQLKEGFRLACTAYPFEDITIQLAEAAEVEFEVIIANEKEQNQKWKNEKELNKKDLTETTGKSDQRSTEDCESIRNLGELDSGGDSRYGIGIDLGTTTLALSMVDLSNGKTIDTYTSVNHQRTYGADVITRIQRSNQGKQKELQECIRQDLLVGIRSLIEKTGIKVGELEKITIAGNTTMGHLLLGYSCESLGMYPFTPINVQETIVNFREIFGSDESQAEVVLLPGISTFVGGDITAGLLVCDFDKTDNINMFLDLGTNGEMAIGNRDSILVTSTAAGPAFEGGNISCGVGSIAGAISSVEIENERIHVKTIGDKAPIGICGTGVLELTSELLKEKIIDDTGLLSPQFFDSGYMVVNHKELPMVFTQRDIREFQMAKAAIRAGIEILVREYGISYDTIDTIYVAGGFGYKLNMEKALYIGMLPKELTGKIRTIGNSSLQGAINYLTDQQASKRAQDILRVAEEKHLSNHEDFNDLYIAYMGFEQDGISI